MPSGLEAGEAKKSQKSSIKQLAKSSRLTSNILFHAANAKETAKTYEESSTGGQHDWKAENKQHK